jgi:hypothetical protein
MNGKKSPDPERTGDFLPKSAGKTENISRNKFIDSSFYLI